MCTDVVVHLRDRPFHQTMMMGGKGVKEEDGTAMREDTINDIIIRKDQGRCLGREKIHCFSPKNNFNFEKRIQQYSQPRFL